MRPGDVVEGRFELKRRVGSGGMGEVFEAIDRASGQTVAVKALLAGSGPRRARFEREAATLAELSHPGIVRYLAHGVAPSGEPYLVMEWLEGEDLDARLARSPLTLDEALTVASRGAAALAAAHARGVVHRDLKPSNLFLVGKDVAHLKLLDFGIALIGGAARLTQTGVVVGTLGYMAPEQTRSHQEIDERADVFALGCVLFECLTGKPAFYGDCGMALLAKILFTETPRVQTFRPEVPSSVDALCGRMLAKDKNARPRDGTAVLEALEALKLLRALDAPPERLSEEPPSPRAALSSTLPPALPSALGRGERRVLSVVLLARSLSAPGDDRFDAPTLTAHDDALIEIARACGGILEVMVGGTVMVMISGVTRVATDQAAQAARCALSLRALYPDHPVVLSTGRGELTGSLLGGDAIDRAVAMLPPPGQAVVEEGGRRPLPIAIDDVTAGLLDARFDVTEGESLHLLHGEREHGEGARTLLGKPTSCVGRDWELMTLEGLLHECMEEPISRAVLVTAPAGVGKSRLAHEFMQRVRERTPTVAIWIGRVDSLQAGSSFGLLSKVLRSALDIQEGEPIEAQRQKIEARVEARGALSLAAFLGELAGSPFPAEARRELRAARQDAQLMGAQMRDAFIEFLRMETEARPALIVLENLHWGDLSTVRFLEAALRELKDNPLLVLSLARPEIHSLFPRIFADRGMQEIRLKELGRKASQRLVRQVLGDTAGPKTVERLVTLSDGHAFYLEELIRAVAEGRGDALPDTVLSMVEARLAGLDSEARRVLRAASVFGEVCWQSGVESLLGGTTVASVEDRLSELVAREALTRRLASRFPRDPEFAFRHALLREGAYATLTTHDQELGHRLAGAWLERQGERDPLVLAEHFERGKEPSSAAPYFLRAAEQAFQGGDRDAAQKRAVRGLADSASDEVKVALLSFLAEMHGWNNDLTAALPYAEEAMHLSPPGSAAWTRAAGVKLMDALHMGKLDEVSVLVDALERIDPSPDTIAILARVLAVLVMAMQLTGRKEVAAAAYQRLAAIVEPVGERDPVALAWLSGSRMLWEAWMNESPWAGLAWGEVARASRRETGHKPWAMIAQMFIGMCAWHLGAFERASEELTGTLGGGGSSNELGDLTSLRDFFLAGVLTDSGALPRARDCAVQMIERGREQGQRTDEGRGRSALARALFYSGELEAAEREARAAAELLTYIPLEQLLATSMRAAIELAQGRAAVARATSDEVMSRYASMGAWGLKGSFARLVHAEALAAVGELEESRAELAFARARLLENAERISDPAVRRRYLAEIPEHDRTLALSRAWLGDAAAGEE